MVDREELATLVFNMNSDLTAVVMTNLTGFAPGDRVVVKENRAGGTVDRLSADYCWVKMDALEGLCIGYPYEKLKKETKKK